MTTAELFLYVKDGGAYCAPLLLLALLWMNAQRAGLQAELKSKCDKLESLSERTIVVMTKLEGLLTGRKDVA